MKGSNNYASHAETSNVPDFDGLTIEIQAEEACFEVAVYNFLRWETEILASCLLYSCVPVQYQGPKLVIPRDLSGRQLFVFESSEGENDLPLLDQLAYIHAALFSYDPPSEFGAEYFLDRLFQFKSDFLSIAVAPTREFWMHVLESKDQGDHSERR
ncbi:3-hydroxybutyryl-CoA dehydratase, partial [Metarhizium majus ARSEF 297]